MEYVYPIVLTPGKKKSFFVQVPDLDVFTQGKNISDAIHMAEDIICLKVIELQDQKISVPKASDINSLKIESGSITSLVTVDVDYYRKKMRNLTVKKNCTVQAWLCYEAEKAGLNFSAALARGLKEELGLE